MTLNNSKVGLLEIFYDSKCPLCASEMKHLKEKDHNNFIRLVDLHSSDLRKLYPNINFDKAMKILHGYYNGQLLLGLQVTHRAWTIVGKGFWVAPLNWPVLKQLSHVIYLGVAKNRQQISNTLSKLLNLKVVQCNSGVCNDNDDHSNNRGE